ncbi:hypothetical protein pipiens_018924, partial [Culex pipiens pipiens]
MVRMWTNFAITGNPTPSSDNALQNVIWPTFNTQTMQYLDIGQNFGRRKPTEQCPLGHLVRPGAEVQGDNGKLWTVLQLLPVQRDTLCRTSGWRSRASRNPVPHRGWSGVRDASDHGQSCPSLSPLSEYSGGEDCLFINVYSQNLIGSRPVMVWIHGGAFVLGNGDSRIYGPDHLVQENVVVVSFNYRLGILGFFSTGDTQSQGNWGLKDCVEALRWVRANIAAFGGDPNNVTIFGESAPVELWSTFMTLSPMTAGLFHKAIAQSGTALVPWGFQYNPREIKTHRSSAVGSAYNHVPIMFGHTNAESLFMVREHAVDSTVWNEFTRNPGFFVPHFWNIPAGTSEASAVSQAFRNFYWQDRPLGPAINLEWTTFHTDQQFIYAIDKTGRLTADRSPQSTYYYQFSFDGDLNLIKRLLLLTDFPGAVHADEPPYLFSMSNLPVTPILPSNHATVVRQRMVRLWT